MFFGISGTCSLKYVSSVESTKSLESHFKTLVKIQNIRACACTRSIACERVFHLPTLLTWRHAFVADDVLLDIFGGSG